MNTPLTFLITLCALGAACADDKSKTDAAMEMPVPSARHRVADAGGAQ